MNIKLKSFVAGFVSGIFVLTVLMTFFQKKATTICSDSVICRVADTWQVDTENNLFKITETKIYKIVPKPNSYRYAYGVKFQRYTFEFLSGADTTKSTMYGYDAWQYVEKESNDIIDIEEDNLIYAQVYFKVIETIVDTVCYVKEDCGKLEGN